MAAGYLLDGQVDAGALRQALRQVQSRHPALSGRVVGEAGEARLIGCASPAGQLDLVNLTRLAPGRRAEAIADFIRRPPSAALATGPLVRAGLFSLAGESALLVLVGHEGILDHQAAELLRTEISTGYATAAGQPAPAAAVAAPRGRRPAPEAGGVAGVQEPLAYWAARLTGAPQECTWPHDTPCVNLLRL